MKTKKSRITPQPKPVTKLFSPSDLVWIDIHDEKKLSKGLHQPVAYGFVDPELLKFLNAFGLKSEYSIEVISKSGWEEVSRPLLPCPL